MFGEQIQSASLIVTTGAVAFALAVALWAYRLTEGTRSAHRRWRSRAEELEEKLDRSDAIFAAHPGVILVWEDEEEEFDPFADAALSDDELALELKSELKSDWGEPRLFGSPPALAAILRFAEATDGPNAGARILDGLADFDARDGVGDLTNLRKSLIDLRANGTPFSLEIEGPQNRRVEADGRPAGRRAVLWLADSTVKGIDVRRPEAGGAPGPDPVAFIDLLTKAPFPVWRMSSGVKVQWANPAYIEMVEAGSLQDVIARDIQLDGEVKNQARKALAHGARTEETRAIVAGGERRHFAISLFPISGGVAGVAVDTTEVEEARAALERHVRAQDDALNHLRDAVAIFSPQQELVFHNRAFRILFDFDEAFLNQRPSHGEVLDEMRQRRLIPDRADYPDWRAKELARYSSLETETPEEMWSLPDDRMLRVARLRHPMGGLLMIFDDMSREVTLETEYNTLIKVQRTTLDKLNEGVAVFGPNGCVKLNNAAFETLWGIPAGGITEGMPFDEVVEKCLELFADRDEWAAIKARVTDMSAEARRPVSREIRRSDGTILAYLQRPLPDGATVIAFHDITAVRKLEAALKDRNAALEAADDMKSKFIENVSRQLRAPMTSIMGFAEILNATILGKLTENEASQLSAILEAGNHLNKLVEDIIDLSAIEAKTIELDIDVMPILPTLESALNFVQSRAEDTRVRLSISCPHGLGAIRADARRIKQVVYNLLLNSLRHTKAGGSIEVGAEPEGEGIRLWVEDDGVGIPIEKQGRIFDAFQSGDHGGAGLGLTLVREFVEMHGGWVEVESEANVGTRVTCHLPAKPPEEDGDNEPAESSDPEDAPY